jgi:DNA-binding LacI/PurR family transcriptional regulator
MGKKVTSSDIAKLAHVSQSTVSRALNPDHAWQISPKKRMEILSLCRQHGYIGGRSSSPRTFKVGLLMGRMEADLSDSRFMIHQLCDKLQANGYTLTLIRVDFSSRTLARDVRRILKSSIADIYVIGAVLLSGQTVELLHRISHRVICLNTTSYFSGSQKLPPWLSTLRYGFEKSFSEAVGQLPSDLLENMVFFGRKTQTAQERLRLLQKCLTARNPAFGSIPHVLYGTNTRLSGLDGYRITAGFVRENLGRLKNRKLYWTDGRVFAAALKDELERAGQVCGRDFEVVSFRSQTVLLQHYERLEDDFCYLVLDADRFADSLCELILSLIDDPTARHEVVPMPFMLSRSLKKRRETTVDSYMKG